MAWLCYNSGMSVQIKSNTVAPEGEEPKVYVPSYPTGAALLRGEAGNIFEQLETKGNIEVAYLFGLDRYFTSESSMRSAVTRAYNLVLDNPKGYAILPTRAAFIQGIVTSRQILKRPETVREKLEVEALDITKVTLNARNLTAKLLMDKLQWLDEHPRALQEESIVNLTKVFTSLFDKGQIVQGAATEHIAVLSQIDSKMDPDEALKAIMQMRENTIAKREK